MPYVFVISNIDNDDMMIMMMMNETSVCIIPVFQRQSESNDVSFVHKRIIFYIV